MPPTERFLDIGLRLRLLLWPGGDGVPFLLLHGLASNARTWCRVAELLNDTGHPVAAVDQRGHGLSEKPETGYDLATVADDAARAVEALGWQAAFLVGQSWGATVVLEAAARHPRLAQGVGCVDGGFLDLRRFPDPTWEGISLKLRPPHLSGTPRHRLETMVRAANPQWDDTGVQATLANFETLEDGTVRPWLSLDHHMAILRGLWELDVPSLFPRVDAPVVLCVAGDGRLPEGIRGEQVAAAQAGLRRCTVRRFPDADHDIHVHRPRQLAEVLQEELEQGVWGPGP